MQTQTFDNITFVEDKNGYFRKSDNFSKTMHRYVWEYYNGAIPKGYEVHHIDFNRGNNDITNLKLLTIEQHKKLHADNLSDAQRDWRRNNIIQNAVPKAVAWHKSEYGHKWHSEHIKQQRLSGKFKSKLICTNCGKEFVGERKTQNNFCCNACKSAYRRKMGVDLITKVCSVCGKEFNTNKYRPASTCSRGCSNRLKWRIKNESEISKKD